MSRGCRAPAHAAAAGRTGGRVGWTHSPEPEDSHLPSVGAFTADWIEDTLAEPGEVIPVIELRPLTRGDYPLLSDWLREPAVRRCWADDPSLSAIEEEYGAAAGGIDPARVLIASVQGTPFGLIQWHRYLVEVPEARRRGPGSPMVTAVLERRGFHRVGEADLEPDNPEDDRRHLVYRLDLPTDGTEGADPRWGTGPRL